MKAIYFSEININNLTVATTNGDPFAIDDYADYVREFVADATEAEMYTQEDSEFEDFRSRLDNIETDRIYVVYNDDAERMILA